jgi:hypothetical protein
MSNNSITSVIINAINNISSNIEEKNIISTIVKRDNIGNISVSGIDFTDISTPLIVNSSITRSDTGINYNLSNSTLSHNFNSVTNYSIVNTLTNTLSNSNVLNSSEYLYQILRSDNNIIINQLILDMTTTNPPSFSVEFFNYSINTNTLGSSVSTLQIFNYNNNNTFPLNPITLLIDSYYVLVIKVLSGNLRLNQFSITDANQQVYFNNYFSTSTNNSLRYKLSGKINIISSLDGLGNLNINSVKINNGATNGSILTSNSIGLGSWQPKLTLTTFITSTTLGDFDVYIIDNGSNITITLPLAKNNNYKTYYIKNNNATSNIIPSELDTIDGVNSLYSLSGSYSSVQIISDNISNWYIIGSYTNVV